MFINNTRNKKCIIYFASFKPKTKSLRPSCYKKLTPHVQTAKMGVFKNRGAAEKSGDKFSFVQNSRKYQIKVPNFAVILKMHGTPYP